jgi:hypothetical protein
MNPHTYIRGRTFVQPYTGPKPPDVFSYSFSQFLKDVFFGEFSPVTGLCMVLLAATTVLVMTFSLSADMDKYAIGSDTPHNRHITQPQVLGDFDTIRLGHAVVKSEDPAIYLVTKTGLYKFVSPFALVSWELDLSQVENASPAENLLPIVGSVGVNPAFAGQVSFVSYTSP